MPSRHVACPLCTSAVELGAGSFEHETFGTCPTCLHTIIVGPVGKGYEARLPGGRYPSASTGSQPITSIPHGIVDTSDSWLNIDALEQANPGFETKAGGSHEHNWHMWSAIRRATRTVLQAIGGSGIIVWGPMACCQSFFNMLRRAIATYPITTMIWALLTALAISGILTAMWVIVLLLIRVAS